MAITTYDGLVQAYATSQPIWVSKVTVATQLAAGRSSLWRATGIPVQGAIPTVTGNTCLTTLAGAMRADGLSVGYTVATGNTAYLGKATFTQSLACNMYLYDRIMHNGGLAGNTTALTAIVGFDVSGISDRLIAADYSNLDWYAEIYTDIGTTASVVTINYDSPTATGRTCTVTIGGTSPANQDSRAFRIYPAVGHPIKLINSVRLTNSTGTAGSWGITACRPIANFAVPAVTIGGGVNLDFAGLGMPILATAGSCLFAILTTSTTSTGQLDGSLSVIQG
jgi:hypothetical protein